MKKVLIGCGIVFLVLLVLCTGVTVWGVTSFNRTVARYQVAAGKLQDVSKKYPYTPPADGALTSEQLDRFFGMRDFVLADVNSDTFLSAIMNPDPKNPPNIGVMDIISFGTSYPPGLMERTAAELERRQMSPQEYVLTGRLIYATIEQGKSREIDGVKNIYDQIESAVDGINNQLAKNAQNAQHQVNFERIMKDLDVSGDVPPSNFELLLEHKDRILEFPQLTFFEFLMLKEMDKQGHSLPPMTITPGEGAEPQLAP